MVFSLIVMGVTTHQFQTTNKYVVLATLVTGFAIGYDLFHKTQSKFVGCGFSLALVSR